MILNEINSVFLYNLRHLHHALVQYPMKSKAISVWRTMRAFVFFRNQLSFLRQPLVQNYIRHRANFDLFYYLTHRNYLSTFLTLKERAKFVMFHVQTEQRYFDEAYKQAVYLNGGLQLWAREVGGVRFNIRLRMASVIAQEGDLEVAMFVDEQRLHSFKFSWIDGALIGYPQKIVPWVTSCQGLRQSIVDAPAKFSVAFPNNWAKLFCLSALRGVALEVGSPEFVGINGAGHPVSIAVSCEQLIATYDTFWESLQGVATTRFGYRISSKLISKDIKEVSSKHRKRTEQRRLYWSEIEQESASVIRNHLVVACNKPGFGAHSSEE